MQARTQGVSSLRWAALGSVLIMGRVCMYASATEETRAIREVAAWMHDGSGDFSDHDPPRDWDAATGRNILWKVRLPNWSNGSPIVVAGRAFVMCEPFTGLPELLCIDAETGALIWKREVDWIAQLPEEEAAEVRRRLTGFYAWSSDLLRQMAELREMRAAERRKPFKAPVNLDGSEPEPEKEDAAARRWRQAEERARELGWSGKFGGRAGGSLSLLVNQDARSQDLRDFIAKYTPVYPAWGPGVGTYRWSQGFFGETWEGMTFPTPVSDGRHVWVLTGHNVIACYDFEGNLRWMKRFSSRPRLEDLTQEARELASRGKGDKWPHPVPGGGDFSTAPRLMGGKLIVQAGKFVRALDPATGELLWEVPDCYPNGHSQSSPEYLEVSGTPAVITGMKGEVLRLADGAFLGGPVAEGIRLRVWKNVVLCGMKKGVAALRLSLTEEEATPADEAIDEQGRKRSGRLLVETAWQSTDISLSGRNAIADDRMFGGGWVADLNTGELLAGGSRGGLSSAGGGYVWPMRLLVKRCELSIDAAGGRFVFRDTTTHKVLGDIQMDKDPLGDANIDHVGSRIGCRSWHVFGAGLPFAYRDRLYVRSHDYLYCIGRSVEGTPRDDPEVASVIRGAEGVDEIEKYLASGSAQYRYEAVRKVSGGSDTRDLKPETRDLLRRLAAEDPYPEIRAAAIVALHTENGAPGAELLREQLLGAVDGLGRLKNVEMVQMLLAMEGDVLGACLTRMLGGTDVKVALAAAGAAEYVGKPLGGGLRDALIAAMKRDAGKWRNLAERSAGALNAWGADPAVMASFRQFLNNREIGAQRSIYEHLVRHGPAETRADVCRSAASGNPDRHVQGMARDELVKIAANDDEILSFLMEQASLGHGDYSSALRSLEPPERRLSALRRVLASDKGAVAAAGMMMCIDLDPLAAAKRLQELAPSMSDPMIDGVLRGALRDASRCTDKDARKRYAAVLTSWLKRDQNERYRGMVVDQLGRLGPAAAAALNALKAIDPGSDKRLAEGLRKAIEAIDPGGDEPEGEGLMKDIADMEELIPQ